MRPHRDHLLRFIGRVYRRMVLLRVVEGAGLGLLAASAAGMIPLLILLYQGEAVPPGAVWFLLAGGMVGALWNAVRRPRLLDAALETDRQLELSELLSTALAIVQNPKAASESHPTAEAFAAAVVATAELRCAGLSASAVVLHRLGARAWGGIGLTTALAVTLGLVAANPLDTRASIPSYAGQLQRVESASTQRQPPASSGSSASAVEIRPIVPDDPNGDENGFNPARQGTTVVTDTAEGGRGAEGANAEGAGPGVGTSRASKPSESLEASGTGASAARAGGLPSGGTGLAREASGLGGTGSGGSIGRAAAARAAPAWRSSAWPSAQRQAEAAVRSGQIPQEYQDLVRAYFDR